MKGFELEDGVRNVRHVIVDMVRSVGFVDVDETNME
jgi:hypothetical protein